MLGSAAFARGGCSTNPANWITMDSEGCWAMTEHAGATVLIIDDDESVRRSFIRTLEQEGYTVETATTGESGLERLRGAPVDLVLLDLHLPRMDGIEVLSALRQGGLDVPVLMVSGEGTIEAAVEAVQLGARDFMQKPVEPERLKVSVRNALSYA